MSAELMDGSRVAAELLEESRLRVAALVEKTGVQPCLATVLVGDDPASATYVKMKANRCKKIGMESRRVELPADTTQETLMETMSSLAADPAVHGILLQHPIPSHLDERAAFEAIGPVKDVDGVTLASFGQMAMAEGAPGGAPAHESCTPGGILRLLDAYDVPLKGKHAVVVGRSPILGKPVAMLLLARDATVTICHSRTADLAAEVGRADIVVAAVGRPELVRGDWIKEGAVVIDAGYNPGNVGDVEGAAAAERASLITPVPGGVGPMTISVLLSQTVDAAEYLLGASTD